MRWRELLHQIADRSPSREALARLRPAPARPRQIAAAERRLRMKLPPSYRAFLMAHDGWPDLFDGVRLFGTRELGRPIGDPAVALLCARMGAPPPSAGERGRFVPFGADACAGSVLAWDTAADRILGELPVVAWLGDVGTHLTDFTATLELVLELLPLESRAISVAPREEPRRLAGVV